MITPISNIGPTPEPAKVRAAAEETVKPVAVLAKSEPKKTEKAEAESASSQSSGVLRQPVPPYDLRLTVEKDPETGEVVYKSINRLTGEVVKQMPNAEVMAMKRHEKYEAGAIIVTDV